VTSEHKKQPTGDLSKLAWDTIVELRKEILESQKIRAQLIGVKVTFVNAVFGVIAAQQVNPSTLAAPAFAAIFFDFLIVSYSFSIKRIGYYVGAYREDDTPPLLLLAGGMLLWQEFMHSSESKDRSSLFGQSLSLYGNVGMTALATALSGFGIWFAERRPSLFTCELVSSFRWESFLS